MLNRVELIGRLGHDPEIRYMPNGTPVATLSIATTRRWKDKTSGERREETEWHRVRFYSAIAKVCGDYLRKGSLVHIKGRIKTERYEKNGEDRYSTGIIGESMLMLDSKRDGQNGGGNAQYSEQNDSQTAGADDDFDDDIPF